MNKIYKLIWSKTKNCLVVASELAKGYGKNKSRIKNSLLAIFVMSALLAGGVADVQALTQQEKEEVKNEVAKYLLDKIAHGGEIPGVDATRGPTNFPDAIANRIFYYSDISNKIGEKLKNDGLTLRYFGVRPDYYEPSRDYLERYANKDWTNVDNDGAFGAHSMALGYRAFSEAKHGVAIGRSALAGGSLWKGDYGGDGGVAIGNHAWALGDKSVSVGNDARAVHKGIAIGIQAEAGLDEDDNTTDWSTAPGFTPKQGKSIQYDPKTKLPYVTSDLRDKMGAIAIGIDAKAHGNHSTAMGVGAKAKSRYAWSFGYSSEASGVGSIAFGSRATAKGTNAIAIGSGNYDQPNGGAQAYSEDTIAIGRGSVAGNKDDTATAYNSVAVGREARAYGKNSIALGGTANVGDIWQKQLADGGTAIGSSSNAALENATAIGYKSIAYGKDAVTLGANTRADIDGGVALGSDSNVGSYASPSYGKAGKVGYDPLGTDADETSTWKATKAAVSVGNQQKDITRQIINVAAGTDNTDAVNVAQLKTLGRKAWKDLAEAKDQLGARIAANTTNITDLSGKVRTNAQDIGRLKTDVQTNDTRIRYLYDNMPFMHYVSVNEKNTNKTTDNRNNNGAKAVGSIAIGVNAHSDGEDAVTLGYNSFSKGQGSVVIGETSDNYTGGYAAKKGQFDQSIILGSNNTIFAQAAKNGGREDKIIGNMNRVEESHGTFVRGTGNMVYDAYNDEALTDEDKQKERDFLDPIDGGDPTGLFQKGRSHVTVEGDGNLVGGALYTQVSGVGNEVSNSQPDENSPSTPRVTYNIVTGNRNTVVDSSHNLIMGDNHELENVNGNIIIGSQKTKTKTEKSNVTILGNDANVSVEGGVALGTGSVASTAAEVAGYDPLTGEASAKTTSTWKSGNGAVSVGTADKTRQITNLAAGTQDTDAVNVAQLKSSKTAVEAGDYVTVTKKTEDGKGTTYTVKGPTLSIDGGNLTVNADEKDGKKVGYKLSLNKELTGLTSVSSEAFKVGDKTYINSQGINANSNKITNVAAGAADGDAVNFKQLSDVKSISTTNQTNIGKLQAGFTVKDGGTGKADVTLGGDTKQEVTFKAAVDKTTQATENGSSLTSTVDTDRNVTYKLNMNQLKKDLGITEGTDGVMSSWKLQAKGDTTPQDIKNGEAVTFDVAAADKGLTVAREGKTIKYGIDGSAIDIANNQSITNLGKRIDNLDPIHYFSVKSDDSANPDGTNWNNDGATGNDAVAAGRYAKAYGNQSQATGKNAWSIGAYSQASGYNAVAAAEKGIDAAAYNALSEEEKENYKLNTQSEGTKNTSLYYRTKFKEYTKDEFNALPVMERHFLEAEKGYSYDKEKQVWTITPGAVAIGHAAKAIGLSTLAVGDLAEATSKYAVAVGREAEATDVANTALGYYAKAKGLRSTALGVATRATDFESMAVGPYARAEGKVSLALGSNAHAKGNNSIAMGRRSESTGESSIALGGSAKTQAQGSVAIGMMAESRQKGSVALGEASLADREAGVWGHDISTGQKMNEDALLGAGKAAYDAEKTKLTELEGQEQALRNEYEASLAQDQVAPNGNHIPSAATQAIKNKLDAKIAEVDTQAIKVANTVKTWRATSGALSVGNTGLAVTRQITGVAAGTEDTDAVNVAQLKALNKKVDKSGVHYFSVNSDDKNAPDGTNWKNDGATGQDAVAIGKNAEASGKSAFATGWKSKAAGYSDIAIGREAEATGGWGVAIGQSAKAQASTAVAMAYDAKAKGANSLAIGVQSEARTNDSIAYGRGAKALGDVALAVGTLTKAEGNHSSVFGFEATTDSTAWNGTAIGRGAYIGKQAPDGTKPDIGVSDNYYTPVDDDTVVEPGKETKNSTAVGFGAKSFGYQNTAVGAGAEAFDTNTVAVGVMSKAIGHYANALGKQARAEGMNSTAIGHFARALGESSMALGDYAITSTLDGTGKVNHSVALGSHARVAADNSLALGYNSLASIADDVKTEAYLSKETFKKENGVVSVGNKEYTVGNEKIKQNYRRIINVAGGADDNDAVNVAQLRNLATAPMNFYFGGKKEGNTYTPGNTNWSMPLNEFRMDFGDGLKAEKVEKDGKTYTLVTLDKDSLKGDPNFKGDPGAPGVPGEKGDKGDPGAPGAPGEKGDKGDPGAKGDKGDPGAKGDKGDPGTPGEKGDKGDPGAKGDKGDPGAKGDKGDPGTPGEKGDKGDPGAKGDKGDPGTPGTPGEKGDKGDSGAKGDKGDPGAKGDKGDPGAKGDKGDPGTPGTPGEKGDKGDPGAKGDKGDPGAKGDKGDPGAKGDKGDPGAKGDKGDPGAKGDKGDPGAPGEKGDKGDPGAKGDKGTNGTNGKSAYEIWLDKQTDKTKTEQDFLNSLKGKDGKDGIGEDKVKEIKTELNTEITKQMNEFKTESVRGDALGAALSALKPLDYDPYNRSQIMAGVSTYKGQEAIALGLAYYSNENTLLHAGLSYAGSSELMANAGISYRFGSSHDRKLLSERNKLMPQYKDGVISSVYVMQDEMTKLQKENEILKEKNAKAEAENKEMRSELEILKKQVSKLMEKI